MCLMPSGDYNYQSWCQSTKEYMELMGVDVAQKTGRNHSTGASNHVGYYGYLRLGSINGNGDGLEVEFDESGAACYWPSTGNMYVSRCLIRA
ncbi:MAG: hypothetical protein H6766_06785 [Candidatus Peribacteria bacterium]|nr:MAG: hypothetical protein H6766_06785 [Candidatus Peribacteria bacterium]